jgi:hypothetical protein
MRFGHEGARLSKPLARHDRVAIAPCLRAVPDRVAGGGEARHPDGKGRDRAFAGHSPTRVDLRAAALKAGKTLDQSGEPC